MSGYKWWWKIAVNCNCVVAWPRSFHCGTDSHLRITQLTILSWSMDQIILEDLSPCDHRNAALSGHSCALGQPLLTSFLLPFLLSLLIWRHYWWKTGLKHLQNSTSDFVVKIVLSYEYFLNDRDLLFHLENNRLGSCCTEHLTGVRGLSVLLPFPLLQLFGALIFFSSASCFSCWSGKYFIVCFTKHHALEFLIIILGLMVLA